MPAALPDTMNVVPLVDHIFPDTVFVHCEAFKGYMNARLGKNYVYAFLKWFAHHEQTLAFAAVSVKNGSCQVKGYVVGAPIGYDRVMNHDLFWPASFGLLTHPWLFFNSNIRQTLVTRLRLLSGALPQPAKQPDLPGPTVSLVSIGVRSDARGQGVGRELMHTFEAAACQLQNSSMRLSVYPDNVSARRLYEQCGWEPVGSAVQPGQAMYYAKILST